MSDISGSVCSCHAVFILLASCFKLQRESKGTVYFSEDMKEAQQAVEDTLTEYKNILEKLSDKQRQDVISTLGLRMEELKAQKMAMEEEIKHDD